MEGDSDSITSEKMLEQPWAVQVEGKRIAIIKGEKGRGLMADIFRQRGALVEAIAMYRREPVSYEQVDWEPKLTTITEAPESSAIIFTSGEILKNFCEMIQNSVVQQQLPQLRCLVPSLRVALEAKEQGFEHILLVGDKYSSGRSGVFNRFTFDARSMGETKYKSFGRRALIT